MRIGRWWVLAAAMTWAMAGSGAASAASFSYDDPRCADFAVSGSGGTYTLNCMFIQQPACQLKAVPANPTAGGTVTLVASCTGNPYGWVFKKGLSAGTISTPICTTTSSACTDTVPAGGVIYYSVFAGNGNGAGPVTIVTVNWQ
jgi:hypothetical protein